MGMGMSELSLFFSSLGPARARRAPFIFSLPRCDCARVCLSLSSSFGLPGLQQGSTTRRGRPPLPRGVARLPSDPGVGPTGEAIGRWSVTDGAPEAR